MEGNKRCYMAESKFSIIFSSHWGIENKLHWGLDIAFNEDRARMRKDNAARNFSIIRKLSLNLRRQDKISKIGVNGKRLRCGWDDKYLLRVLKKEEIR